jgi:hypothetical protein
MAAQDVAVLGHGAIGSQYQVFHHRDDIARLHAGLVRRRAGLHRGNPYARQAAILIADRLAVHADGVHVLTLLQLGDNPLSHIAGNAEGLAGRRITGIMNTDHLPVRINHRPAGIAWVGGSIVFDNRFH